MKPGHNIRKSEKDDILAEKIKFVSSLVNKYKNDKREQIENKYGKISFLDQDRLKFLIINPDTGKPDCGYIFTAYIRATYWENHQGSTEQNKNYYSIIKNLFISLKQFYVTIKLKVGII